MVKRLLLLSLVAFSLGAQAQQLPNVGFEKWKGSGKAGSTYQSSMTGFSGSANGGLRQRPGDEPTDWMGSSINQKVMNVEKKEELILKKGSGDNCYAELINKFVGVNLGITTIGSVAPGYLTFGTPWVYAVSDISKCDGGTYGSKEFTFKPDYIRGKFKKTAVGTAEPSYIIAYVWNGTFKSQIASTSTNDNDRLKDDVDRAILGSVSKTGVTAPSRVTESGKLIAWCNYAFKNTTTSDSDWETISVPLNYVADNITETPSKMNVIISGGDYWTRGNLQDGTTLDVDDVEFVYNSQLKSLSVDGVSVSGFNKDTYNYIIDDFYVDGTTNVAWQDNTFAGVATVNGAYDPVTCKYTIIVKGQDYSVNNTNTHTYTIQFKDAALSALSYEGETIDFSERITNYDLSDVFYDETKLSYTVKGSSATANKSYNEETGILTIAVTSTITGLVTEYTIQFNVKTGPEVVSSKTYSEPLYVTINGETGDKQITEVLVETLENDNINFVLKNFMLGEGDGATPVGNIAVNNIAVASDGTFAFDDGIVIEAGDDPELFWYGPYLGIVPLDLKGRFLDENHIAVAIDIDMTSTLEQMIYVHLGYARATMAVNATAKYGTFCAPFAVEIPTSVTASKVTGVDANGLLTLTDLSKTIPANTPVVLYAENGLETVESFGVAEAGTPTAGLLTGVYEPTDITSGYVLQNLDNKVAFYRVDSEITVPANRCYLTAPAGSVKALAFPDGTLTSISEIQAADEKAVIYDLSGRRVSKATKGIYIINGKKVIK